MDRPHAQSSRHLKMRSNSQPNESKVKALRNTYLSNLKEHPIASVGWTIIMERVGSSKSTCQHGEGDHKIDHILEVDVQARQKGGCEGSML